MLLRWHYTTAKPIPDKQRYSIAQAMLKHERAAVDMVLRDFFRKDGEFWINDRAFEVISEAQIKYDRRAQAGSLGGKQRSSNAQALFNQPQPQPKPEPEESKKEDSFNAHMNGNGLGKKNGHVTISDPQERLNRFQAKLATQLGDQGWLIVSQAIDRQDPKHSQAMQLCRLAAKELGKGWPTGWN